ncbi:MAG: hypothetical protein ACLU0O_04450 [Collinsella sp.]
MPHCGGGGRARVTSEQTIGFPPARMMATRCASPTWVTPARTAPQATTWSVVLTLSRAPGGRLHRLPHGYHRAVLVLSGISGVFSAFAMMCFIPFAMGLFMVLSDGVLHRSLLWWKRGAYSLPMDLPTVLCSRSCRFGSRAARSGPCFRRTECNNINHLCFAGLLGYRTL